MLNQLNEISSTMIGLISILVMVTVFIVTIIVSAKTKKTKFLINFVITIFSIIVSIFLAKPIVSLLDKMFAFSSSMTDRFMNIFGKIQSMNTSVNSANYLQTIEIFGSTEVGLSTTVKSFLTNVFASTKLKYGETTTLSLIASKSFSYLCSLFLIGFILFVVLFVLLKVILKLVLGKKNFLENDKRKKFLTIPLGAFKGIVINLIVLIVMSSIPFFGVSTDYLSTGFQSTKVFQTPYELIVKTEQNLYKDNINWQSVYQSSVNNYDDLKIGEYTDTSESGEYQVSVMLTNSLLSQTVQSSSNISTSSYSYVYYNNKLYLFDTIENIYVASYRYKVTNESNKILVKIQIDNDNMYSTTVEC